MANNLNIELEGKYVIVDRKKYKDKIGIFFVEGGFGTSPSTHGTAVFGKWLSDNTDDRISGYDIERLSTEKEIKEAKEIYDKHRGEKNETKNSWKAGGIVQDKYEAI